MSGGRIARVGAFVEVAPYAPEGDGPLIVAGEDVARVDGDGIDGRVVRLHLAHEGAGVCRPELKETGPAPGDHRWGPGQEGESGYPILVGVVQRPHEWFVRVVQVPLLDTRVPRGREQCAAVQRKVLQPIVVRWPKRG